MNNATFAGRIGCDAELRHTQNGDQVVSFSLAVDEYAGKNERRTLWVDCSMWGKRAESLAQYLVKGASVAVSGQVGIRTYESRGETRPVLTLRVSELTLMGGKSDGGKQDGGQRTQRQAQPAVDDFEDETIPF